MFKASYDRWGTYSSIVISALFIFIALPWWLIFADEVNLMRAYDPPGIEHFLGTDSLGRDLLVRISKNIYTNVFPILMVATLSHLFSVFCFIKLIGHKPFLRVKAILSPAAKLIFSMPLPILIIFGIRLFSFHAVMTIWVLYFIFFFISTFIFLTAIYERDISKPYWQNFLLAGGSHKALVRKYGIKGIWRYELIDRFVVYYQQGLIIETTFSYLGFGVTEPSPSFGNMIAAHYELIFSNQNHALIYILFFFYLSLCMPKAMIHLYKILGLKYQSLRLKCRHSD